MCYFLFTTFTYIFKSLSFSRLNSSNIRFWKRSFYLFWLIELFLFFIYSYLLVNSTNELWVMDMTVLNNYGVNFTQNFIINIILWFFFLNISAFCLLYNNFSNSKLIFIIYFLLVLYFFNKEIYPLYYFNSFFFNYCYINDMYDDSWNLESLAYYSRSIFYYVYIVLILKFWHIIFINIFFLFFLNSSNKINNLTISSNNLSFLYQNILFLFLFFLLNLLFLLKFYFLFIFKFFYSEAFFQNNVIIFNSFISNLFKLTFNYDFNFLVFFI